MGAAQSGSLNSRGFTQSIKQNRLPQHDHLTHAGVFNQNSYEIGQRCDQLLQLHYGVGVSNCDLTDFADRNFFISLFLKSNTDGQKRTRKANFVVALDVSGSMNGSLTSQDSQDEKQSRLGLARDAIYMLYEKLQGDDVFSLVTFHTYAKTIIKSQFVKNLNKDQVRTLIYSHFQSGGTTIKEGFNQSLKNIHEFTNKNTLKNYQNRIILLTDVGDNSVANENILIDKIASTQNINTTIIGVSTDFRSQTCQKLIEVKGFNYFCAVKNQDLQTFLSDRFDYTFFRCVSDVQILIESSQINSIKVYGSPDYKKQHPFMGNTVNVTNMKSVFPSALALSLNGKVQTTGGLILVKFQPKDTKNLFELNMKIHLKYQDLDGKDYKKQYVVKQKVMAQEYYSNQAVKKGTRLFYYAETLRNLLEKMNSGQSQLSDANSHKYMEQLTKLKEYCPNGKINELQSIINIVKAKSNPQKARNSVFADF